MLEQNCNCQSFLELWLSLAFVHYLSSYLHTFTPKQNYPSEIRQVALNRFVALSDAAFATVGTLRNPTIMYERMSVVSTFSAMSLKGFLLPKSTAKIRLYFIYSKFYGKTLSYFSIWTPFQHSQAQTTMLIVTITATCSGYSSTVISHCFSKSWTNR